MIFSKKHIYFILEDKNGINQNCINQITLPIASFLRISFQELYKVCHLHFLYGTCNSLYCLLCRFIMSASYAKCIDNLYICEMSCGFTKMASCIKHILSERKFSRTIVLYNNIASRLKLAFLELSFHRYPFLFVSFYKWNIFIPAIDDNIMINKL